jgi:hypothetical protein
MTTGQLLLGLITAVASLGTAFFVWRANTRQTAQREQQSRREEWWRRFQWATELALSGEPERANIGVLLITAAADSELAGVDEQQAAYLVLDQVAQTALAMDESTSHTEQDDSAGGA